MFANKIAGKKRTKGKAEREREGGIERTRCGGSAPLCSLIYADAQRLFLLVRHIARHITIAGYA